MPNNHFHQSASCSCSKSTLLVKARPYARFRCHCSICQKLYKKPYAEFVVIDAKHVELDQQSQLEFAKYRLPPALNRGVCRHCHSPLLAFLRLAPFLKLAFIPVERFEKPDELPEVQGDIFYHRRSQDIDDKLPKTSGYWKSELVVTQAVLKGLMST